MAAGIVTTMVAPSFYGSSVFFASTNAMKFEYTAAFQQLSTELIMRESLAASRVPKGSLGGGIGSCFRLRHF
jgi:hypothetical protein